MFVIVLIIFEYYSFPLAMTEVNDEPLPKTNELFESNLGRNVVFDISIPPDLVMANQIRHGLPLYAGSVSRTPVVYADRLKIRDELNEIAGQKRLKIMGNADFSGEIAGFNPEIIENVIYLPFVYDAVDDLHKTYKLKYFDVYGSILEKQQGIFLDHWETAEADEKEAFRILKKKR
jgi:hypothetical protein